MGPMWGRCEEEEFMEFVVVELNNIIVMVVVVES